jgi:DNA polymerase-1
MVAKSPTKKPRVTKPTMAKELPKKVKLPEVSFTDFGTSFNKETFTCTRCDLCKQHSKYVIPYGNFDGEILIVGDVPNSDEDRSGIPFTGSVGNLLRDGLDLAKIPVNKVLVSNACLCRTPKGRQPSREELAACLPHIKNLINNMPNLRLIILLGNNALGAVLKQQRILDKRGTLIRKDGKVYLPMLHPAAILRNPEHKQTFVRDFAFAYEYLYGTIKTGTYTCCDTIDSALSAMESMRDHEIVAFDIETSSTEGSKDISNFMLDHIIGFSFTAKEYEGYYVPLIADGVELWEPEIKGHLIAKAKEIFGADNKKLILHNGKFDLNFIRKGWDLDLSEPIERDGITGYRYYFDTMLAHHLLWQEPPHDLKFLSRRFPDLSYYESELDEYKKRNKIKDYSNIPKDVIYKYAAADADATIRLYNIYAPELVKNNLWTLMFGITMPLANTFIHTEYHGIRMDKSELLNVKVQLEGEARQLHKEILELAGEEFNINSKPQLIRILFEKLKLPIPDKRTDSGAISTDKETLLKIDHPICKKIIEYSNKTHFLSTYIDGMLARLDDQDVMRTKYNQHTVATGRVSSSNPNLQNVPATDAFRKLFIARPGHSLIMSDFSQIELRVLAHLTKDPTLIDAFQTGKDLHSITGRAIFHKESDAVLAKEERKIAKTVNFGIVYGIMAAALAKQTGVTEDVAQGYISGFHKLYAMIGVFQKNLLVGLRKTKCITNLFGRKHHIPDIDHPNEYIRSEAERTATNSPVQGTAGDITNLAAIRIHARLRAAKIPANMVLQIHDELVYDVEDKYILETANIVYQTMRETAEHYLCVPVLVDQAINDKWIEPKLYKQARYLKQRGLSLRQFHTYMDEYEAKKSEVKSSSNPVV